MKTWPKLIPICLGILGFGLALAWAEPASRPDLGAAIQAIQQAPDPSAAVAAYANGVAIDRNNPQLYAAYVSRMIDLGLPELAYHQAQTLTTMESNNGLAWGVLAYVNARRGQMTEAISAINLAAQQAPDSPFIERTAGEILAWYDVKADKATLPDSAKNGLAKVRQLLEKRTAFASAYDTAKKAYQGQASNTSQFAPSSTQGPTESPSQTPATPEAYGAVTPPPGPYDYPDYSAAAPPPPPYYYPDYYYAYGPGWVEPAPWWWWQPVGFFAGFDFFPFSTVVVFDHHHHDGHHHHDDFAHGHHDDFAHGHHNDFAHGSHSFSHNNVAAWHHDPSGRTTFFGTPARPDPMLARSARQNFQRAPTLMTSRTPGSSFASRSAISPGIDSIPNMSHGSVAPRSFAPTPHLSMPTAPRGGTMLSEGGTLSGHGFSTSPGFAMPHMAPAPSVHSFAMSPPTAPSGGFHSGGVPMGGFHGGAPMGGSHGGGMSMGGGGFHGGGGGGGHR